MKTLAQMSELLSQHKISHQQAVDYCIEWNTDGTKFTQAIVLGDSIINNDPECLWFIYPKQCKECKVKI